MPPDTSNDEFARTHQTSCTMPQGRVTAAKQTTDGNDYTTGYTYNLSGALIEETYPSGRVVKNTLDNDGSLNQVQSKRSGATYLNYANGFTFNAAGAVTSMRLGNGLWETTQFNSRLQPTQIGLGLGSTTPNKLKLDYEYGATASVNNGNITKQTITVPGVAHPFVQAYTYDSLNRITSAEETSNAVQTWKQAYVFDRYGNRTFDESQTTTIEKNCGTSPNFVVCTPDILVINPTASTSTNRLNGTTYDAAGNVIEDAEGRTFIYDADNKQIEAKNSSNVTIGNYYFDGDGKRVKKYVPDTGETTIFVYDAAGKLVAEYSTVVADSNNAKVAYLTNDHLGSPRINTDATGQVITRYDYHPFGEEIARTGYGSDTIRKQFTGYERDEETRLDFAQARYFAFGHGRFSSPDPYNIVFEKNAGRSTKERVRILNNYLFQAQNWNRYTYTINNPINLTDPKGLMYLQDKKGIMYYVDDEIYKKHKKEIRKELGPITEYPDGSIVDVGPEATGEFEPFRGQRALLGAGGVISGVDDDGNLSLGNAGTVTITMDESDPEVQADPTSPGGITDPRYGTNTIWFELVPGSEYRGSMYTSCQYRSCDWRTNNIAPANDCFQDAAVVTQRIGIGDKVMPNGACYPGYMQTNVRVPTFFGNGKCVQISERPIPVNPCQWR